MLDLTSVFSAFPVLETEHCLLRAVTPDDAGDILRVMGNPEVNRYLGRHPMQSVDEAMKRIQMWQTSFETQAGLAWATTWRADRQFMGTITLFNLVPAHYRGELGYTLAPEWWGKGIMTEVATRVIDFAFNTMGLHSLAAQIDPPNEASRRVLEKQGFVQEGYYREDFFNPVTNTFGDTAVFSLLQSDWQARQRLE